MVIGSPMTSICMGWTFCCVEAWEAEATVTTSMAGSRSLAAAASSIQVGDILLDADCYLNDWPSLLERNEGRDLVAARILTR